MSVEVIGTIVIGSCFFPSPIFGTSNLPIMGVSLNGGKTPISHPKMMIFNRKTNGFVGETHHFRKPPYQWSEFPGETSIGGLGSRSSPQLARNISGI